MRVALPRPAHTSIFSPPVRGLAAHCHADGADGHPAAPGLGVGQVPSETGEQRMVATFAGAGTETRWCRFGREEAGVSAQVLLVHGAWHGGWCFDRVTSLLA